MKSSIINKKIIFSLIGILLIILTIEIISLTENNSLIFPSIKDIFNSIVNLFKSGSILFIFKLLLRVIISIFICLILTLIIVIIHEINNDSIYLFKPILSIFKSLPVIIVTLFIWLLLSPEVGLYIVCIISILPIMVDGVISSLDNIQDKYKKIYLMETKNIFNILFKVKLPLISNNILLTILQTLGMAIKVSVVSEYVYQVNNSIGKELKFAYDYTNMSDLLAIGLLLVLLEIIISSIISMMKKKIELNNKE